MHYIIWFAISAIVYGKLKFSKMRNQLVLVLLQFYFGKVTPRRRSCQLTTWNGMAMETNFARTAGWEWLQFNPHIQVTIANSGKRFSVCVIYDVGLLCCLIVAFSTLTLLAGLEKKHPVT